MDMKLGSKKGTQRGLVMRGLGVAKKSSSLDPGDAIKTNESLHSPGGSLSNSLCRWILDSGGLQRFPPAC